MAPAQGPATRSVAPTAPSVTSGAPGFAGAASVAPAASAEDVISGAVRAALEEVPHMDTPLTELGTETRSAVPRARRVFVVAALRMGLDSLAAAQLRNQLQSSFGVKLPATLLRQTQHSELSEAVLKHKKSAMMGVLECHEVRFEHPSIAELSNFVSQAILEHKRL
eukprot:Skav201314  [mRNA]  locus=scaffold1490:133826:134763:- [translate_table: standard]